jgi:hypothetical protein
MRIFHDVCRESLRHTAHTQRLARTTRQPPLPTERLWPLESLKMLYTYIVLHPIRLKPACSSDTSGSLSRQAPTVACPPDPHWGGGSHTRVAHVCRGACASYMSHDLLTYSIKARISLIEMRLHGPTAVYVHHHHHHVTPQGMPLLRRRHVGHLTPCVSRQAPNHCLELSPWPQLKQP